MRIEQFLNNVTGYDFLKAFDLTTNKKITGRWEVWFQVELALHLITKFKDDDIRIIREFPYPDKKRSAIFLLDMDMRWEMRLILS
jgi:hypothetical protein